MDDFAERRFVAAFICKERRERLLYELTTPAKRYRGISRFCHGAGGLLDPARIAMHGEDLDDRPAFADFVARHDEVCLVLSPDPALDGRQLPLRDAVVQAMVCPDAVLILGDTFAVVFAEAMKGGREKYLLTLPREK